MFGLLRGLVTEIGNKTTAKSSILVLGIDGFGKTTIIESVLGEQVPSRRPKMIRPTTGLNTATISERNLFIRFWDIGGGTSFRPLWGDDLSDATAVLYVVNGNQQEGIHETCKLFDDISIEFQKSIAIVFLNADSQILDMFRSADRATVFFIKVTNVSDIRRLYDWIRGTAALDR
jgi:GTPase SAR1 family protein